jgi:sialate O-acetylesterase
MRAFDASKDKNYVNTSVDIWETKILLSSSEIDRLMYARCCWKNYADITTFGENGIPLAPFRTSNRTKCCSIYSLDCLIQI